VDAADNLYVAGSTDQLVKVSPGGSSSAFGPHLFPGTPRGVAVDAYGFVYVSVTGESIRKISPTGEGSTFATGAGLSGPVGLAFDSAGNLYVANLNNGTVSRITTSGAVSTFATIPGGAKWVTVYPVPKFNPGPLAISLAGTEAVLSWTGNFTLQSSTNAAGVFVDVAGATSPYNNPLTLGAQQFFRLRN
jgi:sugar lactone lactonase YvrE